MPKKQRIRKKLENKCKKRKSAPFDRYATPVKFDRAPKNTFCHESCQKEKRGRRRKKEIVREQTLESLRNNAGSLFEEDVIIVAVVAREYLKTLDEEDPSVRSRKIEEARSRAIPSTSLDSIVLLGFLRNTPNEQYLLLDNYIELGTERSFRWTKRRIKAIG